MKLNFFSNQTVPKTMGPYSSSPKISFTKAGAIVLNVAAMNMMDVKPKDKISLAQDPDTPANWYVFKDKDNGFEIRAGYKGKAGMFNHRELSELFLDCFGLPKDKSNSFKIGGQPTVWDKTKYWGLLVMAPIADED